MTATETISTAHALTRLVKVLKAVSPLKRAALTHLALTEAAEGETDCGCGGAKLPPADPEPQASML